MSCLTWIQVPRYLCNLHPCSSSPPSRCTDLHLSSIPISPPIEVLRVASKLHPNHISTMPGLRNVHLTFIYVHSHCHRSPLIGISSPSRSRFTCVLVESHLNLSHDNCISAPPRSNYTPIQVSRHLCLTAIHPLSTPSRPLDSRLTFIQIESHSNPGPHNCISPPSRWHLTPSQVPAIASQIHRDTISDPHWFQNVHLTSILALAHLNPEPRILPLLHPCTFSLPSRSIDFHLTPIQVMSQIHPHPLD